MQKVYTPIGIQPGTKLLQLRYEEESKSWILWISHDRLYKFGTFLRLSSDGGMQRVTLRPDGSEDVFVVK